MAVHFKTKSVLFNKPGLLVFFIVLLYFNSKCVNVVIFTLKAVTLTLVNISTLYLIKTKYMYVIK